MRSWSAVVACVAVLFVPGVVEARAPAAPQKDWSQLRTANFRVVGNARDADLRRVASRLEQFREALGILFPKAVLVSSAPTTVIVFRGDREYVPFKPLYNGKPKEIAGYFLPGPTANYVTMATTAIEQFGHIVYHEYVHLVLHNNMDRLPLWFDEGLAEYYATFEVTSDGKQASLGRMQNNHVLRLREQWMPLPALLTAGHDSPYYNESDKMSVFYAESWALVHYLLLGNERKYVQGLGAFVTSLSGGTPLEDACQSAFNLAPAALEHEVRQYVESLRFTRQVLTFTDRIGDIEQVPVTPLDEASVHAILGDLFFRMKRAEEGHAEIDAALALAPELPEAHRVLGRLLLASDRRSEATVHLAKAVAAPDAPWASHYEFATLLLQARAAGATGLDADIEQTLRRVIALQPSFAEAYAQLARMKGQSHATVDEAVGLVQRALNLAPGNERYWLLLADVYAFKGDYAAAQVVASRLVTGAKDQLVRTHALAVLNGATQMLEAEQRSPVRTTAAGAAASTTGGADASTKSGTAAEPLTIPTFRTLEAGEDRVAGTLTKIRCPSASTPTTFVIVSHGTTTVYEAPSLETVQFISYRADLTGSISCGAQANPTVILTFTAGATGRPPRAVAIEFVPLGYEPK